MKRYLNEAKKVEQLQFTASPNEDPSMFFFSYQLCADLISKVPDGGSTPQMICGLLIELSNSDRGNNVVVSGHKDSVSATNTTSKKPGDAVEEINGQIEFIYEITVKAFHEDRLMESYEAIKAYSNADRVRNVFVLCRPEDVPDGATELCTEDLLMAQWLYQDVAYYFLNIFEWIQERLLMLTPEGRNNFYQQLADYINHPNSSEKVKQFLMQWHKEHQPE